MNDTGNCGRCWKKRANVCRADDCNTLLCKDCIYCSSCHYKCANCSDEYDKAQFHACACPTHNTKNEGRYCPNCLDTCSRCSLSVCVHCNMQDIYNADVAARAPICADCDNKRIQAAPGLRFTCIACNDDCKADAAYKLQIAPFNMAKYLCEPCHARMEKTTRRAIAAKTHLVQDPRSLGVSKK
jgi:hypothetical protein